MKPYRKENIPLARTLRKNMTTAEKQLWYQFLRQYPVRFQRQKAIGDFIVDFYCAKARLVVELDGSQHGTLYQEEEDLARTQALEEMGLTVIRFWNEEVYRYLPGVADSIDRIVRERLGTDFPADYPKQSGNYPTTASGPPPLTRGGIRWRE